MDPSSSSVSQPAQSGVPPQITTMPLEYDQAKIKKYIARLRDQQNLGLALAGGVVGAAVGAALWGVITALTNFQIGFMAVGVGFLVGFWFAFWAKASIRSTATSAAPSHSSDALPAMFLR